MRDRIALFFLIVLPVLVIIIIGSFTSGVGKFRVGVVELDHAPLAVAIANDVRHAKAFEARDYVSVEAGKTALRRAEISTLVEIPAGTDARLRAGKPVDIQVFGERTNSDQQAAVAAASAVIAANGARVQAARFATDQLGGSFDTHLTIAERVAPGLTSVGVAARVVDSKSHFLPAGFSYSAPTMLVLFVFINSLAGGVAMILSRQLRMYDRMVAAPVLPRQIVVGECVVYFVIALVQSALILFVGAFAFGVHWGNPLAAAVLVGSWALVGTGAGMLAGTVFKTPEQAMSIAPMLGIALGMLGGCMWPLEIVGPTMRTIGHFAPHAWAVDGWISLLSRGERWPTSAPTCSCCWDSQPSCSRSRRAGCSAGSRRSG